MSKIGPDLAHRIAAEQAKGTAASSTLKLWVYVVCLGDPAAIRGAGFDLVAPLGNSARAHLTIDEIERLASHNDVLSVDLPGRVELTLDRSVPEIGSPAAWSVPPVNPANTGKGGGAICAIIDSGVDVFHGSLRKPSGETRVRFYWDQTFLFDGAGNPTDSNSVILTGDNIPLDETNAVATPARAPTVPGCNFGIEFDDSQINDALEAHPDGKNMPISLLDDDSKHGTHVAGTAAGDGSDRDGCTPPFTYQGVAPEADIIVVKMGFSPGRHQDSLAAMDYVFAKAQQLGASGMAKPCAINMSFGSHGNPHNGFSIESNRIDAALAGTTGRAVIMAASNDREGNFHVAETIAINSTTTIDLVVEAGVSRVVVFGSYDANSTLTYVIRMPASVPVRQSQVFNPLAAAVQPTQGHTFQAFLRPSQTGDPDRHFAFSITRLAPATVVEAGTWQIDLLNGATGPSNVHLWQPVPTAPYGGFRPFGFKPRAGIVPSAEDAARPADWRRPAAWISATISSGATTKSAITVAAYDAESANTPIGSFSSEGPALLDLSQGLYPAALPDKPDIAAPGVSINAPKAGARENFLCCYCCVDRYWPMQGTSMAAPHVTGVAALMLAQDPGLNADDIKRIMKDTARLAPALPAGWPVSDVLFGAGRIDAANCSIVARQSAENRAGGGGSGPLPGPSPFISTPLPVRRPWQDFEDRLRAWEQQFGKRPAWQLCAFLVSTHFDEVKRLIDTNRRVGAVWQRHGGPMLVRHIVLSREQPDPPLPEWIGDKPTAVLIEKLIAILARYGGTDLKADTERYRDFVRRLPGLQIAEIDAVAVGSVPS